MILGTFLRTIRLQCNPPLPTIRVQRFKPCALLMQNIPRNRVEAVQAAIATQDPPKEKRDKEILEEDYKSYESKDAENVAPQLIAQNNDAQNDAQGSML